MSHHHLNRRAVIGGLLAMPALVTSARAAQPIDAAVDFGVMTNTLEGDMSAQMQAALDAAGNEGRDLLLPAGRILAHDLQLPASIRIVGQPGKTFLRSQAGSPVARATDPNNLVIEHLGFSGGAGGETRGLLEIVSGYGVTITHCRFMDASGVGIAIDTAGVTIEDSLFVLMGDAAIHATNSVGVFVGSNRIESCGNAGIRIWRDKPGHDGSIITGNWISKIDWKGRGNGQNGNGVNVFQADGVIVSDNVISDCAFTAVRINAGRNTQVRGNTCLNSGEVAIFSEFGFSGSVIGDNIVDGAATGIDITNFDSGGYLATCTGNIVRNITASSAVNPDTRPVGIYAEADTVVANNVIETVPGVGIAAGYGPFVRNVSISDNVLTGCTIGIGVTVVDDPKVGKVMVSGNMISGATGGGVVGLEWENVVSDDLARDASRYPHVTLADNVVG